MLWRVGRLPRVQNECSYRRTASKMERSLCRVEVRRWMLRPELPHEVVKIEADAGFASAASLLSAGKRTTSMLGDLFP